MRSRFGRAGLIFLVGTGRSGTHFLTRCLLSHPHVTDLTDGRENRLVFDTSVRLATGQPRRGDAQALVWKYRWLSARAHGRVLLDQSHPNLWNYELLAPALPDAVWVGLVRDPRAVVASMLRHPGVRRRAEQWQSYPFPNRFLGVDHRNRERFADGSLVVRCAFRWLSHIERTYELARDHDLMPISFEQLVAGPPVTVAPIWLAAGLEPVPQVSVEAEPATLDKWVDVLSDADVADVLEIAASTDSYRALRSRMGESVPY